MQRQWLLCLVLVTAMVRTIAGGPGGMVVVRAAQFAHGAHRWGSTQTRKTQDINIIAEKGLLPNALHIISSERYNIRRIQNHKYNSM